MWSRYSRFLSHLSSSNDEKGYRDLLETHNQSLAYRQLGRFSQPDNCELTNATIKLIFKKPEPSKEDSCRRLKLGPLPTEYYGPRDVNKGRFGEDEQSLVSEWTETGLTGSSGGYLDSDEDDDSQWSLHAMTWPDDSGFHRRIEWNIQEASIPHPTILHHNQIRVGLVLHHDSDPFLISTLGRLQGTHGWFKLRSPTEPSPKSICVRVCPSTHGLAPLDDIAKDLDKEMTTRLLRNLPRPSMPPKRPTLKDASINSGTGNRQRVYQPTTASPSLLDPTLPRKREDYTIGWICALPLATPLEDQNNYIFGNIGPHNIVIASLPNGIYGTTSATSVVSQMVTTFNSLRVSLMVGIAGDAPSRKADIRLGDIVVSKPTGTIGGVMQYGLGERVENGRFEQTGFPNKPPQTLLSTASRMQAEHMSHCGLYSTCQNCDPAQCVNRQPRTFSIPQIHYGIIASGNQVMKHGKTRDRIAEELGVLCFEMEAAGIMDNFPCIVIRGICDYADTHKNDI
ncbi:nucleoside phosphorylase domain-containing protein [Aspergillus undulatus]|uniref:nucleoside phosphorylase domain-containing protein n=1 Tax=Aspergillus undulatus TaxID=1810928 RepID=UPI003CCCD5A2